MSRKAAEIIRLKHKYRRMILRGELDLPLDAARNLVGPDCAYHLYFMIGGGQVSEDPGKDTGRQSRRRKRVR